ncbi:MAG: hypothetical protein LUG85_04955 [Clostridiales bacterium]|nr:hypothetical protein [Clostridiales bacterium]
MKKTLSIILAVVLAFSALTVAVSAAGSSYEVSFIDCPYDVSEYRTDYVGKYMGYEYGVDYWFTITNDDGTTTDVKGWPYNFEVAEGEAFEFTVSIADYIDPTSVKILAYPASLDVSDLYDPDTGKPYEQYYIAASSAGTYGLRPSEDLVVTVSEWHLYNNAFLYDFPSSTYYTTQRVFKDVETGTYYTAEWDNTKVIYENETLYFEVIMPYDEGSTTYNYDTYQVYYTLGSGSSRTTTYLKYPATDDADEINERETRYFYEDELTGQMYLVDVYAIENVQSNVYIKVAGTVTYTLSMLREFFSDFSLEDLDSIDFDSIDFSPIVEYIIRIIILIVKILNGFGLNIDISSIFG